MKISPSHINKYANYPSFGMRTGTVRDDNGRLKHKNTTYFFRNDIEWDKTVKSLMEHFENENHVDTYCIGCSDGSEAYSLVMMTKLLSDNPNKFLPIKASDYDEKIINTAKIGKYLVTKDEYENFNKYTSGKWRNYLDRTPSTKGEMAQMSGASAMEPHGVYLINDNIKNEVEFRVEDCMETLDKMAKKGPKIVLCRNFWPYMSDEKCKEFAKKLSEKLEKGSVVITGGYDDTVDTEVWLELNGFKNAFQESKSFEEPDTVWIKK